MAPQSGAMMLFQNRKPETEEVDTSVAVDRALRHAAVKDPYALKEQTQILENAIATLEAAAQGVDAIGAMIGEGRELTGSAAATENKAKRALIAERYNDMIEAIDTAAKAASANGVNLIDDGHDEIEINLQEHGGVKLAVRHTRLTRGIGGFQLSPARDAFDGDAEIEQIRKELDDAHARLDGLAERYCADAAFLAERLAAFAA